MYYIYITKGVYFVMYLSTTVPSVCLPSKHIRGNYLYLDSKDVNNETLF